jgi:hypothetical protein
VSIGRQSGVSSCNVYAACRVALHHGPLQQARALAATQDSCGKYYDPYFEAVRVETAVVAKLDDAEEQLVSAQRLAGENDFVAAQLLRVAGRLRHDETALKGSVAGWEAIGARFERACTLLLLPERVDEGCAELAALGCAQPGPWWY